MCESACGVTHVITSRAHSAFLYHILILRWFVVAAAVMKMYPFPTPALPRTTSPLAGDETGNPTVSERSDRGRVVHFVWRVRGTRERRWGRLDLCELETPLLSTEVDRG